MMSKKILVIPGGFVPYNDTVTLLTYKHLRLINADMDVVALKGKEDKGIKESLIKDENFKKFNIEYVCNYEQAVATFEKKNIIESILNIFKYKKTCTNKSRINEYGVVYSSSIPGFTHWIAYCIKRKNPSMKWIASFSDPLFKSPYKYDKETISNYSLIGKIGFYVYIFIYMNSFYEKIAMKYADKIVYICEEQRNFMTGNYKNEDELVKKSMIVPLNYIENWKIYSDLINNSKKVIQKPRVLSHFGRVYGLRKVDKLLYALKQMNEEDVEFKDKLIIRQYGEFNDRYKKMIVDFKLSEIFEFYDKIPYDEATQLMIESDILAIFDTIVDDQELQPYLPSKTLEYILLKKDVFILTTLKSPTYRIFKFLGYRPTKNNVGEIIESINNLINKREDIHSYDISFCENGIATSQLKVYIETNVL